MASGPQGKRETRTDLESRKESGSCEKEIQNHLILERKEGMRNPVANTTIGVSTLLTH